MTPSRILATASVVAIAFGTAATAQELPDWNPRTICAEDSTPQYCSFLETQARSQISQQWEFIPTKVREKCLTVNEELGSESWRDFGNCFADASRGPSQDGGDGATQVADAGDEGADDEEVATLQAELDAAKARIAELEASMQTGAASTDERVAELEAELAKVRTAARSSEVRIEGLQERLLAAVDAQDETADTMQSALDKAEARARGAEFRSKALQATLMETLASSKVAGEEGAAFAERIAALEVELVKAQADAKLGAARIEGLQTRLMEATDSAADAGPSERVAELEAQIAEMREEARVASDTDGGRIMVLEAELAKAQAAAENAPSSTDDAAAQRVTDLEAQVATMIEEADAQSEQNRARIADLEDRLVKATKDAQASAGPDEETAAKLSALEADLEKAQASLRSGEVRIEGLQQRLMEANERENVQPDDGERVAALEDSLSVAQMRIENLKSRLTARREALAEEKREREISEGNLSNARDRIAILQDEMIESRRAVAEAATGSEAEAKAVEEGRRLQILLENQRERAARVAEKVAEQRGRIRDLEGEVRGLRRVAANVGAVSCQRRMSDAVGSGGIQFANNKAEIRADAAQTIDRLIAIARDCADQRITVKGHTDTSGDRSYNLQLSQRRADAVVAYMERNGIDPSRVEAVGVGPDEPIADNNTRAGRTQNRRIEIVIE